MVVDNRARRRAGIGARAVGKRNPSKATGPEEFLSLARIFFGDASVGSDDDAPMGCFLSRSLVR